MKSLRLFLATLQFLTRIPVPQRWCDNVTLGDYPRGIIFFPLAGVVIGGLCALLYSLLLSHLGPLLTAVAVALTHIMLTGALHLDGLADSCDGLFSVRSRERMLEIMRDSRIGTNGALALIVAIVLRCALVYQLSLTTLPAVAILIMVPVVGRGLMSVCMHRQCYARESGMGNIFIGKITEGRFYATLAITAGILLLLDGSAAMPALLITLLFAFGFRRWVAKRIGGQTGDTLGAGCELFELIFFVVLLWK